MERLQSAIDKARRSGGRTLGPPGRRGNVLPSDVVEAWAALPELEVKPRNMRRHRITAFEASPGSVPFDIIRTRILRLVREKGCRRIGITSPSPACGKSTVTLNLGLALTRQKETRTILIEGDMRRPSLQRLLRVKIDTSVARLLQGDIPFEQSAQRIGQHFALATNRTPSRNASDVLLSSQVPEVLNEIDRVYRPDLMLFDLPPLLVNDDALALLAHLDCALLIAAAGVTTVAEIDRCERELAESTSVLGTVLNKCEYMPREFGGSYNYYNS